jgi:hypothetical protein
MAKASLVLACSIIFFLCVVTPDVYGIPAFARQYGTSCSTCHVDFPKLNDFGRAFKDAGFKFPKDDESFLKIPPVMLGSQAQKEIWPHSIWPGTIPGVPPIGLRYNTFFQVYGHNRNAYQAQLPVGAPVVPSTDFQPGIFSLLSAGNFGSDIAFWVEDYLSVGGSNSNGGLGDGYLKFVQLGKLFKLPEYSLALKVGQFELDLPFSQERSWNLSGWDIYDEANLGVVNSLVPQQQNVNNESRIAMFGRGVEISGGRSYRGYHYSLAAIDQDTSGRSASGANVSPEIGIFSDSNFKDLYGRFSYRFNLEKDPASRNEIRAAGATGPRDHTFLNLGTFYFYGRSVQHLGGETGTITVQEPFYRVGGDFNYNYRSLNFLGLFMYGHDQDLLPFTPSGLNLPTSLVSGTPAHFSGGFLEADYLALPWMMTIMRWDRVQSTADFLNQIGSQAGSPNRGNYFAAAGDTRNRFTPGVQFLIHANIKASMEYQLRPQQVVYDKTGLRLTSPFRTNQVVAGLEWAY